MARRGVNEEVANAVLDRFEEVQLVDDELFARQWVQSRHAGRGLARRALRQELRERGVEEETVAAAVEAIDEQSEFEAARELVRRRLAGMRFDDPLRRRRRLAGMLARRGYGTGVAMRAIREALDEQENCGEADEADPVDGIDRGDWGE
ncbi:MAG: regulatory protein [Actinomycetota bacterium]|nr:regulatory protein [Actinomycetota bacterium]